MILMSIQAGKQNQRSSQEDKAPASAKQNQPPPSGKASTNTSMVIGPGGSTSSAPSTTSTLNFYQAQDGSSSTTNAGGLNGDNSDNLTGEENGMDGDEIIFTNNKTPAGSNQGSSSQAPGSKKSTDGEGKIVTNIINNVRCHISYPTINYCPKINNNNINNFVINGAGQTEDPNAEPSHQQFSQLSGLSYVKSNATKGSSNQQTVGRGNSFKNDDNGKKGNTGIDSNDITVMGSNRNNSYRDQQPPQLIKKPKQ